MPRRLRVTKSLPWRWPHGQRRYYRSLLDAGADPNGTSEEDQTALMSASLNGHVDAIRPADRGAKVNAAESFKGQTALMFAAGTGIQA